MPLFWVKTCWLTLDAVLPPIATKDLTSADVDNLTTSTRESMLKTLAEMSRKNTSELDAGKATATAIEI